MGAKEDFEARSKGGKATWAKIPKKERSRILSERAKLRWTKTKKTQKKG